MTKNLGLLGLFSLVWSILFYSVLNWFLYNPNHRWPFMLINSVVYGLGFSLVGRYLGEHEKPSRQRQNITIGYAVVPGLVSALGYGILAVWFRPQERVDFWLVGVATILGLIIFGIIVNKKMINGIPKKELFK